MKPTLWLTICLLPLLGSLASCKKKGPLEKAGENLDQAIENASEAINPSGPAEKAGENLDKILGN
jgi:predicted small lipoprotein YifL